MRPLNLIRFRGDRMSVFGSLTDMQSSRKAVRFTLKSRHSVPGEKSPLSANSRNSLLLRRAAVAARPVLTGLKPHSGRGHRSRLGRGKAADKGEGPRDSV